MTFDFSRITLVELAFRGLSFDTTRQTPHRFRRISSQALGNNWRPPGVRKTAMRKMRTLVLAWKTWRRHGRPARRAMWVLLILGFAYLVSPVDLVPDVMPIVGWLDDGMMILAILAAVRRLQTSPMPARIRIQRR